LLHLVENYSDLVLKKNENKEINATPWLAAGLLQCIENHFDDAKIKGRRCEGISTSVTMCVWGGEGATTW